MSKNSTISESLIRIHLDNQRESFEVFKEKKAEEKLRTDSKTETITTMPIPEVESDELNTVKESSWGLWVWILIFAILFFLLWKLLARIITGIREYRALQEETEKTYEYLQKQYEREVPSSKEPFRPKGESKTTSEPQSPLYQELIANQEVRF